MFIALIGTPCSGKNTIVQYLVEKHGFKRVRLNGGSPIESPVRMAVKPFEPWKPGIDYDSRPSRIHKPL